MISSKVDTFLHFRRSPRAGDNAPMTARRRFSGGDRSGLLPGLAQPSDIQEGKEGEEKGRKLSWGRESRVEMKSGGVEGGRVYQSRKLLEAERRRAGYCAIGFGHRRPSLSPSSLFSYSVINSRTPQLNTVGLFIADTVRSGRAGSARGTSCLSAQLPRLLSQIVASMRATTSSRRCRVISLNRFWLRSRIAFLSQCGPESQQTVRHPPGCFSNSMTYCGTCLRHWGCLRLR